MTPPLNLTIPDGAGVQWLPRHGLRLLQPTIIQSVVPAQKLMALAGSQDCTTEAWVSAETNSPSNDAGCLLSWETAPGQRNFSTGDANSNSSTTQNVLRIMASPESAG